MTSLQQTAMRMAINGDWALANALELIVRASNDASVLYGILEHGRMRLVARRAKDGEIEAIDLNGKHVSLNAFAELPPATLQIDAARQTASFYAMQDFVDAFAEAA